MNDVWIPEITIVEAVLDTSAVTTRPLESSDLKKTISRNVSK
ncbi:hypothetical protein RB195_000403 [Necator americanus]|uniref:Uncharacterized protein n=1 Tax=Necator americanus TaxID=51031 RepID=A0ABR1D9J4_NECAM